MKKFLGCVMAAVLTLAASAQTSELNPSRWGVVLDSPAAKNVSVIKDVTYLKDERSTLGVDIYLPPGHKSGDKRPAVIFLNAIGDQQGDKVKNWGIYSSWPRLIATNGMIGISMDADANRIQDSLAGLFASLEKDGPKHGIDPTRLGVYAASANTSQSIPYLMSDRAAKGIRAAALYYGMTPPAETPLRKDLPVLFILAEGDMGGLGQQAFPLWQRVMETRAPWTLMFASSMIHAFDAFQDDDDSRRIIMQTIAFWKAHLEPVPQPSWERSAAREIVAATYGSDANKTARLLEKYIADHPGDGQAHVFHGRALSSLGKLDEAASAYERALALAPTSMFAAGGLGQVRFRQKRYGEAESLLTKAVSMGWRNSMIYGQLAYSQLALNKSDEALRSYESAFQMGIPPGPNTRGLAYFNMAAAYSRLNNADKAFEMLNKAVDEGFAARSTFENDVDIVRLKADKRFTALLERLVVR